MKRERTRPKSVQACASCKKSKVRCEILDDITQETIQTIRCHRCKILQMQCSFESLDNSVFRTGLSRKTQDFKQVVRLNLDKNQQRNQPVGASPASRSSSDVVRSTSGQTLVDLDSLPRHMWQFHRGSTGQWHYDGIFHYEDSLDWAQPLGAVQQLSNLYNASVVKRPRILAAKMTVSVFGIDALDEILSKEQTKNLLDMCVTMSDLHEYSVTHTGSLPTVLKKNTPPG
jgi:hypothetical protein